MESAVVPEQLLNPKEVAQRLKIHVRTVRNMARAGELPAVKIGSDWRFDWAAVWARISSSVNHAAGVA